MREYEGDNSTGYDDTTSRSREYNDVSGYNDSSGYDNSSTEQPTPTTPETPPRENVFPLIEGSGAVNCNAGEACIDPKTGIAHVEYEVQLSVAGIKGMAGSENLIIGDNGGQIAIPKELQNLEVTMDSYYPSKQTAEKTGVTQEVIDVDAKLPIHQSSEQDAEKALSWEWEIGEEFLERADELPEEERFKYFLDNVPVKKYVFDDYVSPHEGWSPVEMAWFSWSDELNEHGFSYRESIKNAELYDYLKIPAFNYSGIMTLRIEGDVKVDPSIKEAYLPIKAEQKSWLCSTSITTPSILGSYQSGCHSLKDYYWASTGDLPKYDLNDPEVNAELAKHYSADGLGGNTRCAVTRETGRKDLVGEDVTPNQLNRLVDKYHTHINSQGEQVKLLGFPGKPTSNVDPIYSAGDAIVNTILLENEYGYRNNEIDHYYVAGYGVDEDGCDQAAVKLTWCPDEEETPPPMPVTETIVTTTRETETVTETITETPSTATTTVTEPTTVTTTPPTVTTTLPPSTVVTTVTPPPATETTTATSEVTTTVTSTPPTETTTLPPETETVTTTETPEPKTLTETTTATTEKTTTETTTATEKIPTTVVTTETPEKETVITSVTPPTVTEHVPTTVVTTQPGTTNATTTTSTVTAPPATVTETKECGCTPTTVTATPKTVTETPAPVTSTVTKEVPTTVVKDRTEIVKLPPETATETPEKVTEMVTTTVEKSGPAPQLTPQLGQVTTVVETPPLVEVPPVILGAFSGTAVWDDNRSKRVNDGDERIPGLTVVAYKDGKEIARTATDENGFYKFDNLEPGEYGIAVYGPDGGELFFDDKVATVVAGGEDTGNDWGFVREDMSAPAPSDVVRKVLASTGVSGFALAGLGALIATLGVLFVIRRKK